MKKTIYVSPINSHVVGEDGVFLKHKPQELKRTPYYIKLLDIGDIEEVSRPKQTKKPRKEAE